ncbi:MAG: tRNA1(Val) (adenine(37)-N6)-methyltransferase [Hyphomicrobiales bacterium]
MSEFPTTTDAFLGGQVMLVQPASNAHRSGSDAVFLAATLHGATGAILDMGAGAGAVGLMAAHTNPDAKITLAERDQQMLACCAKSLERNPRLAARAKVLEVDLLACEPQRIAGGLQRAAFDHVLSNPPYRKAGHVRTNPTKKAAHVVSDHDLDAWMRTAASALKPGGSLTLIFAADGLMDLMEVFKGRFGAVTVLGLHPCQDAPAERVLVRAIKGRKTPPRLLPGLVLHDEDGSYTRQARSILEGHAGIALSN